MKTLEKVGVLSLAKIQALIGLIFGFVFGVFNLILEKVIEQPEQFGVEPLGANALLLGPLAGLIYGFLGGILIAFLYNVLAKLIGGIKLEFKEK